MPAYNKIILKNSSVTGAVPQTAFLEYGELALNYTDGRLYYKNNDNQIKIYGQDDSAVMPIPHTVVKRDEYGSGYVTALTTIPTVECPYVGVTAKSTNNFGATSETINGSYSHGFLGDGRLKLAIDKQAGSLTWFNTLNSGTDPNGGAILTDVPFSKLVSATQTGQLYTATLPNRTGTIAIADTTDGFISTNSIIGLRNELDNINLEIASLQLIISDTPEHFPTGKTIFVDSVVGNDVRGQLSKYAESFPFKTIEAAVNSSVGSTIIVDGSVITLNGNTAQVNLQNHGLLNGRKIAVSGNNNSALNMIDVAVSVLDADNFTYSTTTAGSGAGSGTTTISVLDGEDLIYVRNGDYTVPNQISLNGKGNIYFEPAVNITVSAPSAFLLTANEEKTIVGYANFIALNSSAILSQSSGVIDFQLKKITGTSSGTLFSLSGSSSLTLKFDRVKTLSANCFSLTGSSSLTLHDSHSVECQQFLNCNTTGIVNLDVWSVEGSSADCTARINAAAKFYYSGVHLKNSSPNPCVTFTQVSTTPSEFLLQNLRLSSSDTAIVCDNNSTLFHSIFLDGIKINSISGANTPSILSTNKPTKIYSIATHSNSLPDLSINIDGQYNILPKIF
jgi:hypothetical protein